MNSFGSRSTLRVGNREFEIYRLNALEQHGCSVKHLPFSLRILLENLLRREDGKAVKADDIRALASWSAKSTPVQEIAFMPSRVLLQDFTGVPAVVDLAAMRDAMKALGGDPTLINPLQPAELVIDHSVQVDEFGTAQALQLNADLEFDRNKERYAFLRWGQTAFKNFAIVPPDTGIVHQINLEYLARVVFVGANGESGKPLAYPDTLVGTDSHTTMINGLGVLGWGVGGIEAEAAMLGQPVSMLIPQVVGVRLRNSLKAGSTATDLVLTVTEMLRKHGVVGKFVEFFGPGLHNLPLADRATIANMAPEYGATCGIFPVDHETLKYLRLSGRPEELVALVEAYYKEQGLFHTENTPEAEYTHVLDLDLATIEPSIAGPKRPQDRVPLSKAARVVRTGAAQPAQAGAARSSEARSRWEAEGGRAAGMDSQQDSVAGARSAQWRTESRQRGHRRHHQLHQHFESFGADRRRPAGQEGSRERPDRSRLGEDFARSRLAGRDRVPHPLRPAAVSREAEVQRGRLRLHHLHRQLRPAAAGSFQRGHREGPGRRLGAERQSQLRRPHQLRGARQLPDVAAAGRGLRARRDAWISISTRSRSAIARASRFT